MIKDKLIKNGITYVLIELPFKNGKILNSAIDEQSSFIVNLFLMSFDKPIVKVYKNILLCENSYYAITTERNASRIIGFSEN